MSIILVVWFPRWSRAVPGLFPGHAGWPQHQRDVHTEAGRERAAHAGLVRARHGQWWLDSHPEEERWLGQLLQELGHLQGDGTTGVPLQLRLRAIKMAVGFS